MNPTLFYNELFVQTLGLDTLGLESRFRELVNLVETKTMVTMGNYLPVKYKFYLDLQDPKNIIAKDHATDGVEYYLHDPVLDKYNLQILGIDEINYNNMSAVDPFDPHSAGYYSSVIASRNNISWDSVLMGAEYTHNRTMTDFAFPWKRYHELRGSNVLYLKNYAFGGAVELVCRIRYPNLVAVPEEFRLEYMTLAKYDVKIKLWNELKFLESVVTPTGNLDLKVSDWESAERDREDYLKELRTRSFPDRVMEKYFKLC